MHYGHMHYTINIIKVKIIKDKMNMMKICCYCCCCYKKFPQQKDKSTQTIKLERIGMRQKL